MIIILRLIQVLKTHLFTNCSIDEINPIKEIHDMNSQPVVEILSLQ